MVDPRCRARDLTRSGSAFPRWSSSRPDASSPRSTSRWPTCRCARCSASGSACRCSSTTTPPSPRSPRPTTTELRLVARNLVMLTIGTGVGGGIVLGGRIYRGATGGAGELGHTHRRARHERRRSRRPGGSRSPARSSRSPSGRALDRLAREAARASTRTPRSGGCAPTASRCSAPTRWRPRSDGDPVAGADRRAVGRARRDRDRQRDQHVRSRGGGDRRRRARRPAICCSSRRGASRSATCCPAWAARPRSGWRAHGVRAGVLGAALLAAHELEGPGIPSTAEVQS